MSARREQGRDPQHACDMCGGPLSKADLMEGLSAHTGCAAGNGGNPGRSDNSEKSEKSGLTRTVEKEWGYETQIEPLRWLWRGYLPWNKFVILDGDADLGKTTVAYDLAARVSRGAKWPDGTNGVPKGYVIVLADEDGWRDTGLPRFLAAGGDPKRVVRLGDVKDPTEDDPNRVVPLMIPDHTALIADEVRAIRERDAHAPALILIDMLVSYLNPRTADVNSDQQVRAALRPVARVLEKYGASALALRHLRKPNGGKTKAIHAGGGSVGVTGAARIGLLIAPHPDDPENTRVLAQTKANVLPRGDKAAYSYTFESVPLETLGLTDIPEDGEKTIGRIKWGERIDATADSLLSDAEANEKPVVIALRAILGDHKPHFDVVEALEKQGYSKSAVYRGADELGVVKDKTKEYPARAYWVLPRSDQTSQTSQTSQSSQGSQGLRLVGNAGEES